jgi:hypothetical protein
MTDEEKVRWAIEDIALNPSQVGLTHAKIMRDEIRRLRTRIAGANRTRLLVAELASVLRWLATAIDRLTEEPQ